MAQPFRLSACKVGRVRFVTIGRLTIVYAIARPRPPVAPVIIAPARGTLEADRLRLMFPEPEAPALRPRADMGNALIMFLAALAVLPPALYLAAALTGYNPFAPAPRPLTACELAQLVPTDTNVEACLGRPFLD